MRNFNDYSVNFTDTVCRFNLEISLLYLGEDISTEIEIVT
jgi:hypothetical protein